MAQDKEKPLTTSPRTVPHWGAGRALNVDGVQVICGFPILPHGGMPTKSQCEEMNRALDAYFLRIGKPWLIWSEKLQIEEAA